MAHIFRGRGNLFESPVSEQFLESLESTFNKSDSALPPPPRTRRRLALGSLLLISALSLTLAGLLASQARFALIDGPPKSLGELAEAKLGQESENWIQGAGHVAKDALVFQRRGRKGTFRLARLKGREDFWLVLHAPVAAHGEEYVPPRHFSGRLVQIANAGLKDGSIVELVKKEAEKRQLPASFLLLEGESPRSQRDSLLAMLLFGLLGLTCLGLTGLLLNRSAADEVPAPN